jgi:hypothetical protein
MADENNAAPASASILDPDAWYRYEDFPKFKLPKYSKAQVTRLEKAGRWAKSRQFGGPRSIKHYRGRDLMALSAE